MPHPTPLRSADPARVGPYRLTRRLDGIPSDDPIFLGTAPDGAPVAITILAGEWALDAAARDRFAAEAAVARRVPPFCAARVLDAGLDGTQAYLVSEYVQGPSLLEVVSADGVRRAQDLEALAIGMATGLASIHLAGLVHGNFGPEFVIMAPDGAPRVVEFGITPPYGAATPSADMLAWAQTLIFAASGRPPATLDDLEVLPARLREPAGRCLDTEPAERPAARAVVQSLLGAQDLPAGLLAEGSRRAMRPTRPGYDRARPGNLDYVTASDGGDLDPEQAGRRGQANGRPEPARARATARRRAGRAVRARSRRRAGRLLVLGAVAVLMVIGAVAVHGLLAYADHTGNGRLSADTGSTGKKAPSASASPSQAPVMPAAFTGSWSGIVRQPPTDTYYVSVTLQPGSPAGTVSYSGTGFSCSGALALRQASAEKIQLSQGIVHGQSDCSNGQVAITLTGPGKVSFSFRSGGPANGPVASGTLTRQ